MAFNDSMTIPPGLVRRILVDHIGLDEDEAHRILRGVSVQNVAVIYHYEAEGYWAESPHVPGFYASGDSLAETRDQVRGALGFHLGAEVAVTEQFLEAASVVSGVTATVPDTWFVSAAVVVGSAVTAAGRLSSRLVATASIPPTIKVTYDR